MMLPESAEESDGLGVPANAEGESHSGGWDESVR